MVELAQALTAEGQVAEALRALDEGIRKLGPIVPLQGYALDLELGRKNNDAALARLETILARALRKESWFARRGDILLVVGRTAEARKSYEAALAAVKRLPGRLQQGPAMVKLQAHVNAALAGITNAPTVRPSQMRKYATHNFKRPSWNPIPNPGSAARRHRRSADFQSAFRDRGRDLALG